VSFGIYIVGYFIFIVGVAIAANLLNVPLQWIGVGVNKETRYATA